MDLMKQDFVNDIEKIVADKDGATIFRRNGTQGPADLSTFLPAIDYSKIKEVVIRGNENAFNAHIHHHSGRVDAQVWVKQNEDMFPQQGELT